MLGLYSLIRRFDKPTADSRGLRTHGLAIWSGAVLRDTRVDRIPAPSREVVVRLHVIVHGFVDRFNPVGVLVSVLGVVRGLDALGYYAVDNT